MTQLWKVVSGAEQGGVLVRKECGLTSDTESTRLAPDAIVKELGFQDGRLHYELISGRGPANGWVTINLRGKDLLLKEGAEEKPVRKARSGPFSQWMATPNGKAEHESKESSCPVASPEGQGQAENIDDALSTTSEEKASEQGAKHAEDGRSEISTTSEEKASEEGMKHVADIKNVISEISTTSREKADKQPSTEEKDVLRRYADKFGQAVDCRKEGTGHKGELLQVREKKTPDDAIEAALAFKRQSQMSKQNISLIHLDSNGERIPLCPMCVLPIGESSYDCLGTCVHGECMAQVLAQGGHLTEKRARQIQNAEKMKSRLQYDIGWRMENVPKNSMIAARLGCSPTPQGMCCLVYDEAAQTVRIAATHEPAASVNLEYLVLALKVRKYRNREPLFSLDPVDHKNLDTCLQKKVYIPEWLAGTSVGDVMFQADYYMKELALGEYDMPAAGMLSILDMSFEGKTEKGWAAREWFVVKKAEVRIAEDRTLIPNVKMGVEAREQVVGNQGLEDKPVTSSNHPCKKFADAFTRNFDLIAERKSVVYHLRELAKASVLAKFLVDSKARVEDSWYDAADAIIRSTQPEAHRQIPQLWNMRGNSRIQLKEGKLVNMANGHESSLQAVYGGVNFGLDKLELQQRSVQPSLGPPQGIPHRTRGLAPDMAGQMRSIAPDAPAQQGMRPMQAQSKMGMQMGPAQTGMQPYQTGRKVVGVTAGPTPASFSDRFTIGADRGNAPQGVDLNLDKFSLSEPDRMNNILPPCSASPDSVEGRVSLGKAFLQNFQQSTGLKQEHQQLLRSILNPAICDRIEEGAAFIPPEPHAEYMGRVRHLVAEEHRLLENRKTRFFAQDFVAENPGPEFPGTWASRCQVAKVAADQHRLMRIDVDSEFQKFLLGDILLGVSPSFEKTTEDGVVFRIYCAGRLQIRTTEHRVGEEVVGAVFSRQTPFWKPSPGKLPKQVREGERVVKAKVYIEMVETDSMHSTSSASPNMACGRFYVVLETEASNVVVTEMLADGSSTWVLNAENLEDRNSLARLLFTTECRGTTLQRIRSLQAKDSTPIPESEVPAASKAYAEAIFQLISGAGFCGKWGSTVTVSTQPVHPSVPSLVQRKPTSSTGSKSKKANVGPDFSRVKMEIF